MIRLPDPCLVVLVGPAGSGKSTWAAANLRPDQVVSSDRLRGLVGLDEHDQRASADAFAVLDLAIERRLRRGLTTVVDSTALEDERRSRYRALAAAAGVPCIAIAFDTPEDECRARNRARPHSVPTSALTTQIRRYADVRAGLDAEGFAAVHPAAPAELVPPHLVDAPAGAARQAEQRLGLRFDLQVGRFSLVGETDLRNALADVARAAEDAGFRRLWVMDHFLQIPHVGREWDDILESYTTLGYLAGVTERIGLGVLVTGVTYRNLAHLGKIVATLDVLSGGRAACGLGAAWFAREHEVYGWGPLPPVAHRYALLEDALELLPLLWGRGTPKYEGRTIAVPAAICYPRPVQPRIPILVGGSGERRTLRLVAQYADACNLFGDADTVRHKIAVLHRHCVEVRRDPADIEITHLSSARLLTPGEARTEAGAAGLDDQIGRYRAMAEAGVQTAVLSIPGNLHPAAVSAFAELVAAFRAS